MIRLGMVGCGNISGVHAQRFDASADRMRVTATVDIDLAAAQRAAAALGAEKAVVDYRDVVDDVDAVLVALPHHLHHSVGMDFINAGKHVLMEKPLANSEAECIDLIEAAEARGVVLMVAYCMRYHPLVEKMQEVLARQTYGETFKLSMWTEQFTRWPNDDDWIHRAATLGGGQLFSHGCHYVDLLLAMLGEPAEGTHTGTNKGTPWMEREGTSDVSIKFADGTVGYHGATWGAHGSRLGYSFHALTTEGCVEADITSGQLNFIREGKERLLLSTDGATKHVEREMSHFLDCVENGQRPLTDGPSSLQGLRVIWRLYEAEEKGVVADLRGLGLDQPWR